MSLKIRMSRAGTKKRPFYRIVLADSRSPRDGRFLERLGSYDPLLPSDHKARLTLAEERIKHWLKMGATPSERVARFLSAAGMIPAPVRREQPEQSMPRVERRKIQEARAPKPAAADAAGGDKAGAKKPAAKGDKAAAPAPAE